MEVLHWLEQSKLECEVLAAAQKAPTQAQGQNSILGYLPS